MKILKFLGIKTAPERMIYSTTKEPELIQLNIELALDRDAWKARALKAEKALGKSHNKPCNKESRAKQKKA